MDFIEWNEMMSVGVTKFDDEHKFLVSQVNKLNHNLSVGASQKTMSDILLSLVKYTIVHFRHEEDYMTLYDYPDMIKHRNEHEELKKQVGDFKERIDTGKSFFSLELLIFLRDWLSNHIMKSDMAYRDFFLGKGVQ